MRTLAYSNIVFIPCTECDTVGLVLKNILIIRQAVLKSGRPAARPLYSANDLL